MGKIDYTLLKFAKPEKKIKKEVKMIKKQSKKQATVERKRYSIITTDLENCYFCGRNRTKLDWHEIFRGCNRKNSIIYGLTVKSCRFCHNEETKIPDLNLMELGKKRFKEVWPELDFLKIFGKNYIETKERRQVHGNI